MQLEPVRAGGPLNVASPGTAFTWGGSPPTAAITPDTGALGILDANTALSNLLAAAAAWENIPSSSITLPNTGPENSIMGPEGNGDFAVSNYMEFMGCNSSLPGMSPMIFDNEDKDSNGNGDIFDELGLSASILGFAGPDCNMGSTLTEGFAIFNGPAVRADDPTGENFRGVMTHELGHFLNLDHSVVNGQALFFMGSDSLFPDGTPLVPQVADIETMYPLVDDSPTGTAKDAATPHQDDIAIASTLYPEPSMPLSSFGTITGTLSDAPSTPRTGGQIIARRVGNRYQDAVSAISGNFLLEDTPGNEPGEYELNMLTPGQSYTLEVRDTVDGSFSTPVFVPPGGMATPSLGPLPGPEEFYSGPTTENHSLSFDDPTAAPFLIPVSAGGPSFPVVADLMLSASTTLVANFMNGNTDFLKSRVYLWNSSTAPGDMTVGVFTLPLAGGTAKELPGSPLNLATLGARSARNLKLAEDILTPLGETPPYTIDGGNLTLEFTVQAPRVRGAAQVFDNSSTLAFGTYPLQETPSISSTGPTVLVANFMNGNTDFLKSRVYLWNPSPSPGAITVRVFTLPLTGGMAMELPGSPLNLGSLAAKSAVNLKLAEDILTPLGMTPPYTADGGNLTLEFTIQAGDVRGAAQVFSSSIAFGTYTLQETPSFSGAGPTVLVANFMNGNTDFLKSRVYLWNSSTAPGDMTVGVFTLPLAGGTAKELPGSPLNLATLGARSARNLKLAEDILTPLGMTPPYTTDGGNLTLEFTIQAGDVRGAAQVFDNSLTLAFGTYPLQETPSISSTGPTVLVANFMNGNTDFLKSRVYLWNPSPSPGAITVRVFTLPLTGGMAMELPGSPLNLGSLAAKSAVNLKLAEDILTPLGMTPPYTADGGNLTLEFTIQAGDVRGAAQVFSSSIAFGTYTLSEVPE